MTAFVPSEPNDQHKCDHCGALYDVTWEESAETESRDVSCECCGGWMDGWTATAHPIFTLVGACPGTSP